jgi:hypothetical protein
MSETTARKDPDEAPTIEYNEPLLTLVLVKQIVRNVDGEKRFIHTDTAGNPIAGELPWQIKNMALRMTAVPDDGYTASTALLVMPPEYLVIDLGEGRKALYTLANRNVQDAKVEFLIIR